MNYRAEISTVFFDLKSWGLNKSVKVNNAILAVGYDLLGLMMKPDDVGLKHRARVNIELLRIIAGNEG